MIKQFERSDGWSDELVDKFIADSLSDEFPINHNDITVDGEVMSVVLGDNTTETRILELSAIAKNLKASLIVEE